MSDKYYLLMYYVHSYFESVRHELIINQSTTVENFRDGPSNKKHYKKIHEHSLS